jgi:hypothetical protein
MLRQHKLNGHVVLAEDSRNLMQGLPSLPAPPHVVPLLLRKLYPPPKCHNTTFREKIYIRWCCIDRLSRQGLSECGNLAKPARWQHSDKMTHQELASAMIKYSRIFFPEAPRPNKKQKLAWLGDGLLFAASIGGHDP